jgi:hypothetical protein
MRNFHFIGFNYLDPGCRLGFSASGFGVNSVRLINNAKMQIKQEKGRLTIKIRR